MIDLYCERTAPGLWEEPINALTNLSFFVAAWFAWRLDSPPSPWPRSCGAGGRYQSDGGALSAA